MKAVRAVELDLLQKFDSFCRKHDITYFVDSGTLLGAVRHGGFIPWDDDIDVVVFRDDYERIKELAPKEFCDPYFFQCAYTDEEYYYGHAQLRNSHTAAILAPQLNQVKFNCGIFLDIFPVDYQPDGDLAVKLAFKKKQLYRLPIFVLRFGYNEAQWVRNIPKRAICKWLMRNGPLQAYAKFEKACRRKSGRFVDKALFYVELSDYKHLSAEWFSGTELMDFETLKVPAPSGYKEILTTYYGPDYMTPVHEASMHDSEGQTIFDPYRSYKHYFVS